MNLYDQEDISNESEVTQSQPVRKQELVPRETLILQAYTQVNDQNVNLSIYYGNFILPPINGIYQQLPDERYKKMLENFLYSDEGCKYKYPTEQEIDRVSNETKAYLETLKEKKEEKEEETQQPKEEVIKEEKPVKEVAPEIIEQPAKEVLPEDIKVGDDSYLFAERDDTLESKEKELMEKAEAIRKDREQRQKIKELEKQLEREKKKAASSIERLTREVLIKNEDKDVSFDRTLLKIVSICLILASALLGILVFIVKIH